MISPCKSPAKGCGVYFAEPPWTKDSPEWRAIDKELPEKAAVRLLVGAVENHLDLQPLWASYGPGGSDALRPDLMLKIVLMEVWSGRQRPSQWCQDARKDDFLKWAGMGVRPSRSTWYHFRNRVGPLLDAWFRVVLGIARQAGITPARRGALDGTFLGANASRHHLLNEERLEKRRAESKQQCERDAAEGGGPQTTPAWMAKTPLTRRAQAQRYAQARSRLDEFLAINGRQEPRQRRPRNKIVVSATDPAAAVGWDKYRVFRPLYNLQLMRDLDSPLTLAFEVFARNGDGGLFRPMVHRTQKSTDIPLATVACDATYMTACNLAMCEQEHITLYGPWRENDYSRSAAKDRPRMLPKERFTWLPEEQCYRCPQEHLLTWIGKQKRVRADGEINVMHSYRCSPQHCRACPLQSQCTTNPARGRSVKRSEHEPLVDAHRARMETEEAKAVYRLRKQTVELGYADLKGNRHLREFSGRGLTRVRTEAGLNELARNLIILETMLSRQNHPGTTKNAVNDTS